MERVIYKLTGPNILNRLIPNDISGFKTDFSTLFKWTKAGTVIFPAPHTICNSFGLNNRRNSRYGEANSKFALEAANVLLSTVLRFAFLTVIL